MGRSSVVKEQSSQARRSLTTLREHQLEGTYRKWWPRASSRRDPLMRLVERLVWWLAPVIALALVLLTSYQAVTVRRFEAANGLTGELLAGKSVGQTFVARYDGLSGVELELGTYLQYTGPAKASLVLHLRESPPGVEGRKTNDESAVGLRSTERDLATVTVPAGTSLAPNPWYRFSFPPIPESQNHSYYVELESPDGAPGHALTVYWWRPDANNPNGDPYADGSAYLNGRPRPGDLAFALHYEPSPLSAAAQMARAISANLPGQAMLVLFVSVAAVVGALLYLLAALREPERRGRWLRRWSLPFVLGVALLGGLLYMFLVPPWQGPDEHTHFAYAAMLDHYDLNYDRVQEIYSQSKTPDKQLVDNINASMVRHDFTRLLSGHPAPGSPPDAGSTLYTALSKPPAYYWLGAVALRLARVSGIITDPYSNPDAALLVLRGVSLLWV